MCSLPTQELSISLHELRLSLKQLFSFPHNLIYLDQEKHTHWLSLSDSFVISFFTPRCVFVFPFLLKFSCLKQLFHHVTPLLQNPSWQSFTICFSNSFPASSAQTLLLSLTGFLPPGQTSWPVPTSLFMSPVPPKPSPVIAAQGPCPWQHSFPQENFLPWIHSMYGIFHPAIILLCGICSVILFC